MAVADMNRSGTGVSMGAVWGDYDNDGYEDLFLLKWGKPELYHNDHGHGFTRVDGGLPPWINANTAIWFDYDGDGLLDLFVGGYYAENIDLWHLRNTRMMPESFEYAKNGGRKYGARAGTGSGQIEGTITDPSGAAIPKAKVTATNNTTGVALTFETNKTGAYLLTPLKPDEYTLSVEATGFQKHVQEHHHHRWSPKPEAEREDGRRVG